MNPEAIMTTPETSSPPRRRLRYLLITLAACAVTIALFYAEEDWRGWRAMEQCRRELEAKGVSLDWSSYIPAPVPEDQNVFGVPEMQEGFTGRGEKKLTKKWPNIGRDDTNRMVIVQIKIGLPGTTAPTGSTVLNWGDTNTQNALIRLIKEAIGPVAIDPIGWFHPKQSPAEMRVAQVFLQCQTQPGEKEVQKLLPDEIYKDDYDYEKVKVAPTGEGSYNVTMRTPITAAEFLKLNEAIEPDLALIRKALQRPYARMNGDYSEPSEVPIPNFVALRTLAQRLAARAACHLLLSQPEEALRDLTLTHDICQRVLQDNKPMTLVSAMINVAVAGLDMSIIADGLRKHAWREPQLVALEEQLKPINLLPPVKEAFGMEQEAACFLLRNKTTAQLEKLFNPATGGVTQTHFPHDSNLKDTLKTWAQLCAWKLIPRGWAYQNLVTAVNLFSHVDDCIDPAGKRIFPDKAQASRQYTYAILAHWSPYNFLTGEMFPNFSRALQTTAQNQMEVEQTLVACALERYRLAHGEYPETLETLVPQFIDAIPREVLDDGPLHYHRNADGTYLLYSIGWDGKDYGGHALDFVWPVLKDG